MSAFANIVAGGVFHAAVLFLVAAGLQLVFGVQKIVNLACGSFYALGAYFGITFIGYAHQYGVSEWLILPGLIISGLLLGFIGPPIERMLRTVYDRDESFQLLLTFALVLMFQDVFKFVWGAVVFIWGILWSIRNWRAATKSWRFRPWSEDFRRLCERLLETCPTPNGCWWAWTCKS